MKNHSHVKIYITFAVITLLLAPSIHSLFAAELLSDTFTGTTINTAKWTETDAGGVGGTTGNMQQNGSLSMTGSSAWGGNYLRTVDTYNRSSGTLEFEADVTCGSGSSIFGIGYGDPGVLTGGGDSYTVYVVSNLIYFSRQSGNTNAESYSTGVSCTNGVPFHMKMTIGSTTGAVLYLNNSSTAAATSTAGTLNNKGFFLSGHSGTATLVDNVTINGLSAATAPDAPTGLATTTASTQVSLSWTAPSSNGGATVTDYFIEYKLSTAPTWTTFVDSVSAATTAIVTGLTDGLAYNFRVSAINSVGTSTPSAIATATPALSLPSAPRALAAASGESGQSTLTWTEPLTNGGASVTDYLIEYKLSAAPSWTAFVDGASAATTTTVTGLTNSSSYNFRVSAINSVGTSTASSVATGTPNSYTLSDSFTGTTIDTNKWTEHDVAGAGGTSGNVQQNGSLSVTPTAGNWSAQNGLSTVATYDRTNGDVSIQFSVTRSACGTGTGPVAVGYGDMNFTVNGSASYIFISSSGTWDLYYWADGTNQSGSPSTVSDLTSCTNGVPTTFKVVALQAGGASVYLNGSTTPSAQLAGGTFTNEKFWIGGMNAAGTVTYDDVGIIEPNTGPLAPTSLTPTAGSGQVALTWTSGGDNGAAITDYVVQYKSAATSTWSTFSDGTSATAAATVTGLTNGVSYNFRVYAVNTNGTSQVSSLATAMPVSAVATAPTASDVSITGTAALGEQLTGTYTFIDPNGTSEGSSQYRWLRSDTSNGTYTAISGATSDDYTVVSADLGKYLKFEVTPVSTVSPTTGTAVLSAATSQVAQVNYINQILSTGQSLSVGIAANPALSTTQPFSNVMLTGGAGGIGAGTSFTPLIESSVETMSSAMANTVTANTPDDDYEVAVGLHGVSGYTYSQLKKGTSPYNTGMTQVTNTKNAATLLGKTSRVIGVTAIHGETDNFNNVSGATYQTYLEEWQADYEADVKAITGQSGTIPLFLDQMSSFASSYANDATSSIPIYQLKAAEDNVGKIYVVGPKYQYNYSDRHHLTAASSRWDGEYYGKVIKKVAVDHEAWRPLSPDSVTRTGNVIYADFHVPEGELEFDTTLVSERDNYGFEYADSTNSATISTVEILDEDTVKVTLSGTPTGSNQRLRYAYTGVPGTNTGAQNDGSAAGNLRDTDPYPSLYGNTLYNWAVHFDKAVTVDSSAPTASSITVGSVSGTGVTLTWVTDESSSAQIQYGLTTTYTGTTTESVSRTTSHTQSITGLAACTSYHYRVRTEDSGNNTQYSSDATFTTTCTGDATVVASSTTAITVSSGGSFTQGNTSISIPAGFTNTSSSVSFQAKELESTDFFTAIARPAGKSSVGTVVVNLTALANATNTLSSFDEPLTIEFSYEDADVVGLDEASLEIYRYDGSAWYALANCAVDADANTISCETSQFSDFALFGDEEEEVVEEPSSGGGGSSGGGSRRSARTRTVATTNTVTSPSPAVTQGSTQSMFMRDLDVGMTGEDVRALQVFLNTKGYAVAHIGPGAPGYETIMFGYATQAALKRYQTDQGIVPAAGYFGPLTRTSVNAAGATMQTESVVQTGGFSETRVRELELGMAGEDVRNLQKFLNTHGYQVAASGPGSMDNETAVFGFATQAALIRFQKAQGIVPSAGYFGSLTQVHIKSTGMSGVWW